MQNEDDDAGGLAARICKLKLASEEDEVMRKSDRLN